jgi:NAD-dependent dihydropyrimidine dehydrogenase PreA subunit
MTVQTPVATRASQRRVGAPPAAAGAELEALIRSRPKPPASVSRTLRWPARWPLGRRSRACEASCSSRPRWPRRSARAPHRIHRRGAAAARAAARARRQVAADLPPGGRLRPVQGLPPVHPGLPQARLQRRRLRQARRAAPRRGMHRQHAVRPVHLHLPRARHLAGDANRLYESTLFVQLPNPYAADAAANPPPADFAVANPLAVSAGLTFDPYDAEDLKAANRALDEAGFYPLIETMGVATQFVDSRDPDAELERWARENGRAPELARRAARLVYRRCRRCRPEAGPVRLRPHPARGHRRGAACRHRDRFRRRAQAARRAAGEARIGQAYLGAKRRPIGGLLPPGTSTAWKTPYGNEVPVYTRLEKCLGPECALCVTHCPEGAGGETSAIRLVPLVPPAPCRRWCAACAPGS